MKSMHYLGISVLALLVATPALAQTAPPSTPAPTQDVSSVDDVIVTATKREQTLQDVPVSVAVTSEQTIQRSQIRDLIDLQSVVPSLKVAQGAGTGQTNFYIRGFGNGLGNFGIEGSVGVFIDGVYRSRSASSLNDLPEISRVEVLRGPQSTLFGKNVSAGAINIVTAPPQFDFGGRLELSVGNYGQEIAKGTVTGPISDTLAVRLSGTVNRRDGFYNNVTTGGEVNNRDRSSVRGDVLWTPTTNLSVRVIADYNELTEACCAFVQLQNGPATQFVIAPPPFGLGARVTDPANLGSRDVYYTQDPTSHVVGKGISAQVDYDFGSARLTSITAYRDQLDAADYEIDDTSADISSLSARTTIKTFTQEVRLASTGDGPFSWLVGGFYSHENLDTASTYYFGSQIRAYADALSGQAPAALINALPAALRPALTGRSNIYALEFLQSLVTPSIVPGQTYFAAGTALTAPYTLDQDSFSFFGQADFKVTDRLTITGGLAYLNDEKTSTSNVVLTDRFSQLNLQAIPQFPFLGLPANLYGSLAPLQFFYGNTANHGPVNYPNANESGVLKGDKVTYLLRATYAFDNVNLYGSYSTGWKAGAYNLSIDARAPDANGIGRTAAPESVELWEAGLKTSFRGGFVNVAIFDQTIEGFQSNAFTGTGFSLVNAGQQSVRGVEIDAAYRPTSWLALTGGVTYLDPKYDSFTRAPCVNYDTTRCPADPVTGARPLFRDLSGETPSGISKWVYSASATVSHEFGNAFSAFARLEYDFASDMQLTETVPTNLSTYGLNNVNASIGLTYEPQQLEVLLWARNLGDDVTITGAFPTVAQDGSYTGYLNDPRTYGLTLTKRF